MSSTFIAIAGSVGAVALLFVIAIKVYRRYKGKKNERPPVLPQQHVPYPPITPFPMYSPQQPPPHNPYFATPFYQPQSPYRCMHCGVSPAPPRPSEFFTPGESPKRGIEKRTHSHENTELSYN